MDIQIDITDVSLTLTGGGGPVNILRGVDFRAATGETLSIAGPSGAGKTTLLMVLGGLEKPTTGRVRMANTDLTAMNEEALARFRRRHVGIIFQSFHLISTMTALENVALPLEFAGLRDSSVRAADALNAVGLDHRGKHFPSQLSGGEQQRVAVARAFVAHPSVILADEPTGNLDGITGAMVMELLFRLQKEHGTTLVLITHEAELASRCNRRFHMEDGLLEEVLA